jgi:L-ascorbate metabolism protein UlaG (beta-lactamase superfamily)
MWRKITDVLKRKELALRMAAALGRGRGGMRWLDQLNPPAPAELTPDLRGWENRELSAVWIGHATVLLRIGGMTVLTDPVLVNRIGLGLWLTTLGPRRHIAPAMSVGRLPKIDLILISHAHFDHLDRQTLAALDKKTPVVTAGNTRDLVWDLGFRTVKELRWGERFRTNGLAITAREVRHWGARTFIDNYRGYNGYILESGRRRVLYGGDTAYQELFKDIGPVNLAVLGIGAYDPYIHAHATPEQAWEMANHVRADFVLPMHHSTFRLSHEPMHEPLQRILSAAGPDEQRIVARKVGAAWTAN